MTNRNATLWRIDEATDKFVPVSGPAGKPAAGDYVINRGELCRLSIGRHGRLPIVPVAQEAAPVILAHFAALSG